jgi:methyltransferase-like protein
MVEIADEARKFKINILAIQETRWPGQGRIDKRDYSVFYSGPNYRTGQCGTGFIIDAQARKSLMCFEPISDRTCKIKFKGRFRNITSISAYAPTEDSLEENKHDFYNQLYKECSKIPEYDMLVILGNFKAQIGTEAFLKNVA